MVRPWTPRQDRVNTKAFYCTFASDTETGPGQQLSDQLDC
jgi:hypothetical protein